MALLREMTDVRQTPGEPTRRWFSSTDMDLFLWCDDAGTPTGFQLTYDKGASERACTWKPGQGLSCSKIDDGEADSGARHKATPVLVADDDADIDRIVGLVREGGAEIPAAILSFVIAGIRACP